MRLFVTGPTGSGKSTLSRRLSRHYGLPLHSLDDLHWVRLPGGDQRRGMDEKLEMLERIVADDAWVIEGVQFKWAGAALARADRIIVVDTPRLRTQLQVVKRFVGQSLGLEAADYPPSFASLRRAFGWVSDYYAYERDMLMQALEPFGGKTSLFKGPGAALATLIAPGRRADDTGQSGPAA